MTTYCAPCLADLALLRESVTTVSGTAACVAHAVLLLHPGDSAPQRLARLSELRSTAESKIATASTDDIPALELLVQEYALAGAMDMTVPLRDLAGDRTPRPPKTGNRRNRGRDRDRERGPRPERPESSDAAHDGPAGTDERPAGTDDRPAGADERPAGDTTPAAADTPPAAADTPPAASEAPPAADAPAATPAAPAPAPAAEAPAPQAPAAPAPAAEPPAPSAPAPASESPAPSSPASTEVPAG